MASPCPAEVFPPGAFIFIKEELDARSWTAAPMAEALGCPMITANEIITGKRRITPPTARALASAFGTSAEYWLNLEAAFGPQGEAGGRS